MASVYSMEDGNLITAGLQGCNKCDEAIIAARNIARDLGKPVMLDDDDGEWQVNPDGSCELLAAVPDAGDFDFVLCRSDRGDGGWSLHAPDSTDFEIANGDAVALVSGPAEWVDGEGWDRPNEADYQDALAAYREG